MRSWEIGASVRGRTAPHVDLGVAVPRYAWPNLAATSAQVACRATKLGPTISDCVVDHIHRIIPPEDWMWHRPCSCPRFGLERARGPLPEQRRHSRTEKSYVQCEDGDRGGR